MYSSEQMLRAILLRMLNKREYVKDFVEDLADYRQAQVVCHFKESQTPSAATFSRFYRILSKYDEFLWDILAELAVSIGALISKAREGALLDSDAPPFGHILAIDSTDISAFGDPNGRQHVDKEMIVRVVDGKEKREKVHLKPVSPGRCKSKIPGCCTQRTDLDAAWGFRTDKRSKQGKSAFFGYKLHTIVDANYGTPLFFKILPANESDMNQLRPLVEEVLRRYPWLSPKYLLGDKGYDSLEHFVWLRSIGIIPIIAVRRPPKVEFNGRERRLYDGTYTEGGFPLCLGNVPIQFIGSDLERGHLFRCPEGGCSLKDKKFPVHCQDYDWEMPVGKILRIIGVIPRFTREWKELYKLRQAIERFFGSAKRSRLLNKQRCLSMNKVRMHAQLSLLSYSATMLGRLLGGDFKRMRHMRI